MKRLLTALTLVIVSAVPVLAQQRLAPPKVSTLTGLHGNQGDIVNLVGTGDYLCASATCTSAGDWHIITSGSAATPAPAGSGTELQYRSDATTFGAVTGSTTSGGAIGLTNGFLMTVPAPDITSVVAPSDSGAPGAVTAGVHRVKFTWVTTSGETVPSVATAPVTMAGATQMTVPIPQYGQEGTFTVGLNVYMTKAGGSLYYLALADPSHVNHDPETINVADAALVTLAPSTSTALESGYVFTGDGVLVPPYSAVYNADIVTLRASSGFANIQTQTNPADGSSANLLIAPGVAQYGANAGALNLIGGFSNTGTGGTVTIGAGYGMTKGSVQMQDGDFTNRLVIGPTGAITLTPGQLTACPMGQTAPVTLTITDAGVLVMTRGSCE